MCPPIQWKPSKPKATLLSIYLFFVCSICRPKQQVNVLTTRSAPAASTLQRPPCRRRRPTVGCCIPPLSGSHPRPMLRPSLIFLMGAILAPQSRESAAVSVKPATRRLQQTRGEPRRRDLGLWQMLPWRYRAKPLGVGRQRLILFLCYVLCVVCVCDVLHLSIFWVCIR